jgi:hypothetical protein
MASFHKCIYCGKDNFRSKQGLQQHQSQNKRCKHQILQAFKTPSALSAIAHDYMQMMPILYPQAAKPVSNNAAQVSMRSFH